MRSALVTFVTLVLLWMLLAQVNHALSGLRVYLFLGALYVAFAALKLPLHSGLSASFLGGLICDANAPVMFGTHALLFSLAHAVIYHLRDRIPRDDTLARVLVALLTNLGLFLLLSFLQIPHSPSPGAAWTRLIADLVCSQVVLAVLTPWFFSLQMRSLVLARAHHDLPP